MKYLITIILITSLLACNKGDENKSSSNKTHFENLDSFSNHLYGLIIHDDFNKLELLLPTQADLESIYIGSIKEGLLNGSFDSLQVKKSGKSELKPNASKKLEEYFKKSYKKFRHYCKNENFSSKDYKLLYTNFTHKRDYNIETADITYIIRNEIYKENIEIVVEGCLKSKQTWLLGERIDYPDARVREYESSSQFYGEY